MLSVIILNVTNKPFTLSVIMLNVVMVSVVAPLKQLGTNTLAYLETPSLRTK
jgi:hypothetical protein